MKIDKYNIEELIFDYHEGNLTSMQKNQVLDYIHQHPDCEALFAQWAMTYGHVIPKNKDYGLTDRLLKPQRLAWFKSFWFYGGSTALIIALLWWSYYPTTSLPKASQSKTAPSFISPQTSQPDTLAITPAPSQISRPLSPRNKGIASRSKVYHLEETMPAQDTALTLETQELYTESITTSDTIHTSSLKVNAIDTVANKVFKAIQPTKDLKKKKKRKLAWEPTENYVPTNSNF